MSIRIFNLASILLVPSVVISRNGIVAHFFILSVLLLKHYINQLRNIDTYLTTLPYKPTAFWLRDNDRIFLLMVLLLASGSSISCLYHNNLYGSNSLISIMRCFMIILLGFIGLRAAGNHYAKANRALEWMMVGFYVLTVVVLLDGFCHLLSKLNVFHHQVNCNTFYHDIYPLTLLLWPIITYYIIEGRLLVAMLGWLLMMIIAIASDIKNIPLCAATISTILSSILFALAILTGKCFKNIAIITIFIPLITIPILFSSMSTHHRKATVVTEFLANHMPGYPYYSYIWQNAMRKYQDRQFTGWGFGMSQHMYHSDSELRNVMPIDTESNSYPSNIAIQILLECGIVGYAILYIIIILCINSIYRPYHTTVNGYLRLKPMQRQQIVCAGKITTFMSYLFYLLHSANIWQIQVLSIGFLIAMLLSMIQNDINISIKTAI